MFIFCLKKCFIFIFNAQWKTKAFHVIDDQYNSVFMCLNKIRSLFIIGFNLARMKRKIHFAEEEEKKTFEHVFIKQ